MASEPTWEAVKFGGEDAPRPPISFCTSRGSSYKRSVPLCPSNGDVLATPLLVSNPFRSPTYETTCNSEMVSRVASDESLQYTVLARTIRAQSAHKLRHSPANFCVATLLSSTHLCLSHSKQHVASFQAFPLSSFCILQATKI